MKTKIFVLILYLSLNAHSQDIIKKVYTDKTLYTYGETAYITIRAINTSSIQDTLVFPNSCEAYPYIDNIDYKVIFGLGCYSTLSERIVPAQDSIEWIYEYPHPSNPGIFLTVDQHNVFGNFRLIYFNPDTFIISNTDTIDFLVQDSSSAVVSETNQYIYSLEQNYPNPFNPTTSISFTIPQSHYVELKLYDVIGNEIKTLFKGHVLAGRTTIDLTAADLQSGVYFYRIQAGDFVETKKMALLR